VSEISWERSPGSRGDYAGPGSLAPGGAGVILCPEPDGRFGKKPNAPGRDRVPGISYHSKKFRKAGIPEPEPGPGHGNPEATENSLLEGNRGPVISYPGKVP
jgi:hypothetical protein